MVESARDLSLDRQVVGLYLHRSEVHAQREVDQHDPRAAVAKASARARGRKEGFALCTSSTLYYAFKPLGVLREQKEIQDMSFAKVHKVDRTRAKVNANLHATEQKPKAKRGESTSAAEKEDGDLIDEQEKESGRSDPTQLDQYANDSEHFRMERQRNKGRREADGHHMLRQHIRESEWRLRQVKSEAPGMAYGLDYSVSELEGLMPPRSNYPPVPAEKWMHSVRDAEASIEKEGAPDKKASAAAAGRPMSARIVVQNTEIQRSSQSRRPAPPLGPSPAGTGRRPAPPGLALAIKDGGDVGGVSGPQSDRSHRREVYVSAIEAEMKPRPLPIRLPSLGDFIASSGQSTTGAASAAGRGERSQVRETINELLGLPRNAALKLSQEEMTSKRKINFKRKIEKQLDNAWQDRAFWKRCITSQGKDIEELRKRCHGNEQKLALFERYVKELGIGDGGTGVGEADGNASGPAGAAAVAGDGVSGAGGGGHAGGGGGGRGPGAGGEAGNSGGAETGGAGASPGIGSGPSGSGVGGRKKRPTEAEKAASEAEEVAAYDNVVRLMREPDPTISPVARLRSTLASYQASRERHKGYLETMLRSMDADRLSSLKRRAAHLNPTAGGAYSDAKASCALMRIEAEKDMLQQHLHDRMKQQYLWYRNLWTYVQSDKRDMPAVAYFIFDFVKQVLEHGELFTGEMYFAMLGEIEDHEFTSVIAGLIVNMIKEIQGVTPKSIVDWFEDNRGTVPQQVWELVEQSGKTDTVVSPRSGSAAVASANGTAAAESRGTTFVTEA